MLSHHQIRRKFIDFFVKRGHLEIPSSSLLPEYDPTLLLTNSGMAPLKPYFLGVKQPPAPRLTDVQKCVRTGDIDAVGDIHHLTFFEMLGNWSIGREGLTDFQKEGSGPYFKAEACEFAFELLKEFDLDQRRLYFGTFGGDASLPNIPPDLETKKAWLSLGIAAERILDLPLQASFWFSGPTGPCGPNTDVIYDLGEGFGCRQKDCGPAHDCGRFLEIWNAGVFMMYDRDREGILTELPIKSVDAGAGLERFAMVIQGRESAYATDLFAPLIDEIKDLTQIKTGETTERSLRIVADHVRAATFLAGDGLVPSNVEAGYVLRRLIRRAVTHGRLLGIEGYFISELAEVVIENFEETYPNLAQAHSLIHQVLEDEERKFSQSASLKLAIKSINQDIAERGRVSGTTAFNSFSAYGLPIEFTLEIAAAQKAPVEMEEFQKLLTTHRDLSRRSREAKSYDPEKIKTAHTAAHLLNAALKKILGSAVHQMGQKIGEREFRHDFNFDRKLTKVELLEVEDLVNQIIRLNLPVKSVETTFEKAKAEGAEALFEEKYRNLDKVNLYKIGPDDHGQFFSRELCGGPHANSTGELKKFRIVKEGGISAGVRRIHGLVEG